MNDLPKVAVIRATPIVCADDAISLIEVQIILSYKMM